MMYNIPILPHRKGDTMREDFFGTKLRKLREQRGLSLNALSERSGLHQSTISRLETDSKRMPHMETFIQLARGFGISIQELAVLTEVIEPEEDEVLLVRDSCIRAHYRLLREDNLRLLQALEDAEPLTRYHLLQLINRLKKVPEDRPKYKAS